MPVYLIANVTPYKNRLVIGHKNDLVFKLKRDMSFFKKITQSTENNNVFSKNIVVMGSNTWFSLDHRVRPLKDRINIVITNDTELYKLNPDFSYDLIVSELKKSKTNKKFQQVYFVSIEQFKRLYLKHDPTVFVIGGGKLYNTFLTTPELKPKKLYITQVLNCNQQHLKSLKDDLIYMNNFDDEYKLMSVSEKVSENFINYRFLMYTLINKKTANHIYSDLCKKVLCEGKERIDRTGVGTISIFGSQVEYDMSFVFPLLTTKSIPWKHVIEELLWFMRGDTDAKILQNKGVKIWDGNTSRSFLDSRGLTDYPEGTLGAGYSWQWRFFGADYSPDYADTSKINTEIIGGFDQLKYIEQEIKSNPFSRRMLMCYWNPPDFKKTALLPCHFSCQFYVDSGSLHCLFNMRSNDLFLGHPFNISSYAILTMILALRCDLRPGKLIYTGGDIHIYKNHISQVREQLERQGRPLPVLIINPDVKYKNYNDITISDFELVGYFPHPSIKAPMAI